MERVYETLGVVAQFIGLFEHGRESPTLLRRGDKET
jgi:hypothetical protein